MKNTKFLTILYLRLIQVFILRPISLQNLHHSFLPLNSHLDFWEFILRNDGDALCECIFHPFLRLILAKLTIVPDKVIIVMLNFYEL
jgi:hypothetical protein